ncbi:MAG: hypothetical protein ACUVUD_05595 [bacterium]
MKKFFLLLSAFPLLLFARGTSGGMATFGPTLALIDFSNRNRSLRNAGFEELSYRQLTFGDGGYHLANRTLISGAGWVGTQTVTADSLNVVCRINYGGYTISSRTGKPECLQL